jgi:hypothetical protein
MPAEQSIALWASYSFTGPVFHSFPLPVLREAQYTFNPDMKLALLCYLRFTKVYINLEKYVFQYLNFM